MEAVVEDARFHPLFLPPLAQHRQGSRMLREAFMALENAP